MAKMVVAVPNQMMVSQAESAVRALGADASVLLETSETVVQAVERERELGAVVAVARGNHANLLLRQTDIPVIEIVLSGQNLAMLFSQAKKLSGMHRPKIALIGFHNMFGDFSALAEVLDVEVETFFAVGSAELIHAVECARDAGADVVIGGEIAMEHATRIGIPHLFLHSTQDSIETAISLAKRVIYAIELEKHKAAEFTSLVNYSFDAILRLDAHGTVTISNYMAEKIFRRPSDDLRGISIDTLIDLSASDNPISVAMRNQKSVYGCAVRASNQALIANLAAVNVDMENMGYILTLQEFGKIEELEEQIRKERYSRGYVAGQKFADLQSRSPVMNEVKETAMKYARYDLPVLLMGEVGVGKHALAECIHNASLRSRNPFVAVDCSGLSEGMQQRQFMGADAGADAKGAFEIAHTGTLLIEHVDRLDEYCQYQLLHVLKHGCIACMDGKVMLPVDIRVICTTGRNLYQCMREGAFLEPLYCMLTQLELMVPPLSRRAEDLPELLDMYIEKHATLYRKYARLTPGARELVYKQHWGGNLLQLGLFCEKLVLLADDKLITEDFVTKHLPHSFVAADMPSAHLHTLPVVVSDREAAMILQALEKHRGNRAAAALELGMSKTTLWRRMKKYGVQETFR